MPDEWQETARLVSLEEADLPAGRHTFHKEALMTFIHQSDAAANTPAPAKRRGFLRPMFVLPAAACSLAIVAAGLVTLTGSNSNSPTAKPALFAQVGTSTSQGVPQLLNRIALAAAQKPVASVGEGQYIYIESKFGGTYERTVDDITTVVSNGINRRQIWLSGDGTKGWLIDPTNTPAGGESIDRINEKGASEPGRLNAPTHDYLAALPTDADTLLAKIYKETKGMGNNPDQQAFTTIGDLLNESLAPADLNTALFRAAGKVPGVVQVQDAVDAAGRHGVAVARLDETSGARTEMIFDAETYTYLGERTIQVRPHGGDSGKIEPGTILFTSAITARQVVDDLKEVTSSRA
ncbi:CU044_5270 family protein [Streptomyces sp. NPDC006475]|uniref:CU044_5270 family protein n=1 Tax=Streptomyces sp. NPDC006475 TaxID=3155719 RepID=UPI0033A488EF